LAPNRQKRKAEHIEEGYEKRGVSRREAERRAWATVNKEEGGFAVGVGTEGRSNAAAESGGEQPEEFRHSEPQEHQTVEQGMRAQDDRRGFFLAVALFLATATAFNTHSRSVDRSSSTSAGSS